MAAATGLRLIWSVRRSVGLDLLGHAACSSQCRVRCSCSDGPIVAQRRLFPGPDDGRAGVSGDQVRATRAASSARPPAGSAKARSSPTRSTSEYADSMPSARISRDPTSTCPASATHGRSASAATVGDAVRHLAGAAGEVEGALAGDHQVGGPRPGRAGRRRRRPASNPGSRVGAEQQQREAEAAGGAGALLQRGTPVGRRRELPRATPSTTGSRSSAMPFCGPEHLGRAEQPGQRVVDVGGGHQPRRPSSRSRAAARSTRGDARRGRPRPPSSGRVGGGAERRQQARRRRRWCPCRRGPTTTSVGAGLDRLRGPARRRPQVVALSARSLAGAGAARRPGRSRRRPCSPTRSTVAGHRLAVRPAHGDGEQLAAERLVQHVDEARAAVGHRRQVELVAGRAARASPRRWPRPPRPRSACRRTCQGRPGRARRPSCRSPKRCCRPGHEVGGRRRAARRCARRPRAGGARRCPGRQTA